MVKQEKVNIFAVDALRVISILAVILIHTTTRILENGKYDLNNFPLTLYLNQAARFAVPLFFMISGFVLELHYHLNESFAHYLKKRFNKVFLPYMFWSTAFYFFVYTKHSSSFISALISGDASYQLYFIPSLLMFYFLFPLMHKFLKYISNPISITLIGGLQFYLLYKDYYVQHLTLFFPFVIFLFNIFIFIIGMMAANEQEKIKFYLNKVRFYLIPAVLSLSIYIFNEGKTLYLKTYDIGKFYSQWRPDVLIYTLLISSMFYIFFIKTDFEHDIIKKLSKLSFFVYFIHVIVIEILWNLVGTKTYNIAGFTILFFIGVSALSFLIAGLVHKIPRISRVTG